MNVKMVCGVSIHYVPEVLAPPPTRVSSPYATAKASRANDGWQIWNRGSDVMDDGRFPMKAQLHKVLRVPRPYAGTLRGVPLGVLESQREPGGEGNVSRA